MKKNVDVLLLIAVIIPILLLFCPFAIWGDTMSLILRVISSVAAQTLMYRGGKHVIIKSIPSLLTGVLAVENLERKKNL